MKLVSIQIGLPRDVQWEGKTVTTGIFKEPVTGPVAVTKTNLEGDRQADLTVHGGIDKAVYAYSLDAYPGWREKLGDEVRLPNGAFGENLTVSGLDESVICIGDVFTVGTCQLQVSEPRMPCFKLGIKFGDMGILKTFLENGRPGVYFRVVREGSIQPGDEFILSVSDPQRVPLIELFRFNQTRNLSRETLTKILRIQSLSSRWRMKLRTFLDALPA